MGTFSVTTVSSVMSVCRSRDRFDGDDLVSHFVAGSTAGLALGVPPVEWKLTFRLSETGNSGYRQSNKLPVLHKAEIRLLHDGVEP